MDSKRKRKAKAVDLPGLLDPQEEQGEKIDVSCFACGQVHGRPKLVCVFRGKTVSSYSYEYRLWCEARWVLKKLRSKRARQNYLRQVADVRGEASRHELYEAMLELWREQNESNGVS